MIIRRNQLEKAFEIMWQGRERKCWLTVTGELCGIRLLMMLSLPEDDDEFSSLAEDVELLSNIARGRAYV